MANENGVFDFSAPGKSCMIAGGVRVSASEFFGHNFRAPSRTLLIFCRQINVLIIHNISKKLELSELKLKSNFYMVEYCGNF